MAEDAEEALVEVQSGYVGAGYLTSCIVLLHESPEPLHDWARELRRVIQTLGFGCRIESINALEAWLGTHPGNGFANLRRPLVNTLNLADLLPLASIWSGRGYCPCPFYPPDSPPLMAGSAKGQMRQWYATNNPFDRAKEGKLVQVSIKGLPLPVSQDSWRVEWTETVRGHTGAVLVDPQTFEATLTVQLQPPATDAQVMQNPGGIAINGLSFSRVLGGSSDK